jgi:DNA-binding HxlR family transcriptional regulator
VDADAPGPEIDSPQVTYRLTGLGVNLAGPLTVLIGWFGARRDELFEAMTAYDVRTGG